MTQADRLTWGEKYIFATAAVVIVLVAALGFFLIDGEPKIAALVASGHNHSLSFAYGAILFGLLMHRLHLPEAKQRWMAIWTSATYLGPLALIYAGMTGNTSMLEITSPLFMGSFVLLWVLMLMEVLKGGNGND